MSAGSLQRWLVTAFDFSRYDIIVEAFSEADAINRAHAIYWRNGFSDEAFSVPDSGTRWCAKPLVQEVQR